MVGYRWMHCVESVIAQILTLPSGLFIKETTLCEGQGGAHRVRGLGKSVHPAGMCLEWKESRQGHLVGRTQENDESN